MKKMYLIVKTDGRKYWTDSYEEKQGFLVFSVKARSGKILEYKINKSIVAEISEQEFEEKSSPKP